MVDHEFKTSLDNTVKSCLKNQSNKSTTKCLEMKNSVVTSQLIPNLPGHTRKASAVVAGVVPAVWLCSPHTADLDPEDN